MNKSKKTQTLSPLLEEAQIQQNFQACASDSLTYTVLIGIGLNRHYLFYVPYVKHTGINFPVIMRKLLYKIVNVTVHKKQSSIFRGKWY